MKNPAVKTFLSAALILLAMLVITGALTYVIPNGTLDIERMQFTEDASRGIPLLTWMGSPILVLFSDSGVVVISIILFLLIIGGAIHLLKETGLIESVILKIARRFADNERLLMAMLALFFMALGAFVGVFEEVVPLVPLVIFLAAKMGWDVYMGLGVSVLATGFGFAAAVTNPFTIGVAQELAGVPVFSGAVLRLAVFASVYALLMGFLIRHQGRAQRSALPLESGGHADTQSGDTGDFAAPEVPQRAYRFFLASMATLLVLVGLSPFVPVLQSIALPLIGLLFLIAGVGVGCLCTGHIGWVLHTFLKGARDMAPAILLILLATAIKHVMVEGRILDTILYHTAQLMSSVPPLSALLMVLLLVFFLNFFIGSGSAKAFILMPILMPIMDILGMSRQLGILAFQFGDGFSNVLYPTNAVLLIALGLSGVSYAKWFRFIVPLQVLLFLLSMLWLFIAYQLGYGGGVYGI